MALFLFGLRIMSRYLPIPTHLDLPALEAGVLDRWRVENTFFRSVEQRASAPLYVFDDGPPFATGLPHYGHILTSYIKDVVPRYFTMRGYHVPRRWGWDCHGLPVEFEVEKELGLSSRADIVSLGLGEFTDACRALVLRYAGEWERTITRLGRWVDFDHAYRTMDRPYMESVMWAFARLHEKGLIYEGRKVVPYCTRCQTALSQFETRLDDAYRSRVDPACTVRFRLVDHPGASLLAWTTTPWTLPSNVALAVNPDFEYVEYTNVRERLWVAATAAGRYPELAEYQAGRRMWGRELVGRRYMPVFPQFASLPGAFVVLAADFVSAADGTGVVHLAPAFGEDDDAVCRAAGIDGPQPIHDDGTFTADVPELAGLPVLDASAVVIRTLAGKGLLFSHADHKHDYPHCWRCDRPLIHRGIRSWFVKVTAVKDTLCALNQDITWTPAHVRDGRFGQWLEHARDWAISRDRFWGSPIPVWRCSVCAHIHVVGDIAELERLSGLRIVDLHRPHIDAVSFACERCGASMARVPEVLDCWFESGAMPFAHLHYPFENEAALDATLPADFIVEYVAQTRGWFYTLHVMAAALFGRRAFSNAVCHGVVLGTDGRKMSKRLMNYPDPMAVVDAHGSDALRIALLSSSVVRGADVTFHEASVRDAARRLIIPLWNAVHYFTTYASADGFEPTGRAAARSALDRYLLHETERLRVSVEEAMGRYDFVAAYEAIETFIEMLSGWYLRLSRSLAWRHDTCDAKTACYETLHAVLDVVTRVIGPFMPFVAEALRRSIGETLSVHLTDWPAPRPEWCDEGVAGEMATVRTVVRLARSVRERRRIKHRHPLPALFVSGVSESTLAAHADLLLHEVNVKRIEVLTRPDRYVSRSLRLRTGDLGKRLKQRLPHVQRAVASGEFDIRADGALVAGDDVIGPTEYEHRVVLIDPMMPVAAEGTCVVLLDIEPDAALRLEADARDLNRIIQDLRKTAGLSYAERIILAFVGDAHVDAVIDGCGDWLREQTLAVEVGRAPLPAALIAETAMLGESPVRIEIARAPSRSGLS